MTQITCNCPAYEFPHRMTSGECGKNCHHPQVEIEWKRYPGTYYEPDEYEGWACCCQCGEGMPYDDVPEWSEDVSR